VADRAVVGEGRGEIPMPIGRGQFRHDPPTEIQRLREELLLLREELRQTVIGLGARLERVETQLAGLTEGKQAQTPQKNRGGRPPRDDWEAAAIEVAWIEYEAIEGGIQSRAHLLKFVQEYFMKKIPTTDPTNGPLADTSTSGQNG
jgi:hypothetical protein